MKVWVVLEGYDYEGYGRPDGEFVFGSKAEAEARKVYLLGRRIHADDVDIFECEVSDAALASQAEASLTG